MRIELSAELFGVIGFAAQIGARERGAIDRHMDARVSHRSEDFVFDFVERDGLIIYRPVMFFPRGLPPRAQIFDGFALGVFDDEINGEEVIGIDPEGHFARTREARGVGAQQRGKSFFVERVFCPAIIIDEGGVNVILRAFFDVELEEFLVGHGIGLCDDRAGEADQHHDGKNFRKDFYHHIIIYHI